MEVQDLLGLDRKVAAAREALDAWRRDAAAGDPPVIPRAITTRDGYLALGASKDPLAPRLAPHVAALTIDRVTIADEARVRRALRERRVAPSTDTETSVAEATRALLDPRTDRAARLREVIETAAPAHHAILAWAERRDEAARRLGLSGRAALEHAPLDPLGAAELSEQVLCVTDGSFAELRGETLPETLDRGLARDAGEGWPAAITGRWLREALDRGQLFQGLRIAPFTPPAPLGAASFARALSRVGAELARADRPGGSPACLHADPFDLLVASRAALFGALLLEPSFHVRRLGLGPGRARAQARTVARAAVVWLRVAALRAAAWASLPGPGGAPYDELAERSLGRPLPGVLAGVLPRAGPSSSVELAGAVRAASDRMELRARFDEDWFDNPRAHEALRHEHHTPRLEASPTGRVPQGADACAALASWLSEIGL